MRSVGILLGSSLVLALFGTAAADEPSDVYWGTATDMGGKLLYREKHMTWYDGGKIRRSLTEYLGPDGRLIAVMDSDYERSLAMPTYVFRDYRNGREEGLRLQDGRYVIFHRDAQGAEKTRKLEDVEDVYSCQGWHYYVVNHLDRLEEDQDFTLELVFPDKLRTYPFKVEKTGADGDTVFVRVRFAYRALSWLVPKLELKYDRKSRELLEFQGVSNIFDENDDLQEVRITYQR